jgi:hypothetical protein
VAVQFLWRAPWVHTHQLARDLCWLLSAPPFWPWRGEVQDADQGGVVQPLWPATSNTDMANWLQAQADQPDALVAAVGQTLAPKPTSKQALAGSNNPPRLGRLAEALMDFCLKQCPAMHWEATGVKIFHADALGRPTAQQLGELDYLWRDLHGQLVHGELAVKFYALAYQDTPEQGGWHDAALQAIGPDGHENWQHKWRKLNDKQLAHAMPAPWSQEPVRRVAHVRGRWFVPVTSDAALQAWASTDRTSPSDWTHLMGAGPWSHPPCDGLESVGHAPALTHNTARFGPRLCWHQARSLELVQGWQCRLLRRVEWLGPVCQDHGNDLHAPAALRQPALPPSGHPRVQMLGVFAFDVEMQAWCEMWRAWLDAE